MLRLSARLYGWLLPLVMGCGGAAGTAPPPGEEPAGSETSSEGTTATGEGTTPASKGDGAPSEASGSPAGGTEPAAPAREPVLAADSAPAGLKPLTEAEQDQLKGSCAKLVKWAQKRAGKAPTRAAATQKLLEALSGAPQIEGVDVASCRNLLTRDLKVYVARTQEVEAHTTLKMLMLAMASAVDQKGKLCPSAPPVPSKLSAVKTAPYQAQSSDWQADGWKCLRHQSHGAQRFQYEVKSDPAAGTFEIVARGYPVAGGEPTELFLSSRVVNKSVELHSNVFRR